MATTDKTIVVLTFFRFLVSPENCSVVMREVRFERGWTQDSDSSSDEEYPDTERKTAEHHIKIRRRAVIFSIITIFLVTMVVMVMSVVHVEMNKMSAGYDEVICQVTDTGCAKLLCPGGWGWDRTKEECVRISEIATAGVITSAYKQVYYISDIIQADLK